MAVRVYDKTTQREVDVTPAQLQDDIDSGEGRFAPTKAKVRVTREGNRTGTVAADKLTDAIAEGWQVTDEDDYQNRKILREEATLAGEATGLVESAAAGATLGLSTAALEKLGMDPKRMAARREATGGLGVAAEIGGALVPMALSGGGSLGARGLASVARATPAGAVTRGAAGLERGLASSLGNTRSARILSRGAREFVEGAAQGAGAQLDENVLGDRELNADLLGSAAMGGLFGVGASASMSGLAKVATGGARASIDGMRGVLGRMNSATGGTASREAAEIAVREGQDALSPLASGWKRTSKFAGVPDDLADRLARKADTDEGIEHMLRVDREMPRIQEQAARLFTEDVPTVLRQMDEARRVSGGSAKQAMWERHGPATVEGRITAARATDDLFRTNRAELDRMISENVDPRFKSERWHSGVLREADDASSAWERELVEAEQLSSAEKFAKKAMATDNYKRRLGQIIDDNGGWGAMRQVQDPTIREANKQIRTLYANAKNHLEADDIMGGSAAIQRSRNAAYRASVEADELFQEAAAGSGLANMLNPDGSFNMAKAMKLARQHGKVGGDVTVLRFVEALKAKVAHFDEVAKHVDGDEGFATAHKTMKESVSRIEKQLDSLANDAAVADDLATHRSIVGNKSPSQTMLTTGGPAVMSMLGMGVGGPIGAAAGFLAGALTNPHTTLLRYAQIRSMLNKADVKLDGVVSSMFAKAKKLDLPEINLPKMPTAVVGRAGAKGDDERRAKRETALAKAVEISQSPEALERALRVPHYDLHEAAPGLAGVMQQRAQQAAAFLQSKAPKVYSRPNSKTKLVDPVSAASFERYLEAVVDPIGALSRFQSGRITAETAEALRIVYPALYADVQRRIQDHLATEHAEGREVPYDTRIRLGATFSTPTDPSLQPPVANEIQMAIGAQYDEPTAQEAMGGGAPPSGHAGKFDNPDRKARALQTGSERSASWRQLA